MQDIYTGISIPPVDDHVLGQGVTIVFLLEGGLKRSSHLGPKCKNRDEKIKNNCVYSLKEQ